MIEPPPLPPKVLSALNREMDLLIDRMTVLCMDHPEYTHEIAASLLGVAIGIGQQVGFDAERVHEMERS
jgi:hypothetical protein